MSGISRADLRVEERLARDERTCACNGRKHPRAVRCMGCTRAHRLPCDDPHAQGCRALVKPPARSCPACNRQRGETHRYRSERHAS